MTIKKQNLFYLSQLGSIAILLLFIVSCNTPQKKSNQNEIPEKSGSFVGYLHFLTNKSQWGDVKCILLLSSKGCCSCNESFSRSIVSKVINKDSVLIIVAANENILDLSPYIQDTAKNVIFDRKDQNKESVCVFIKNNTIDTSIIIDSDRLANKLQYIQVRLFN